jgi:hypothetical protein
MRRSKFTWVAISLLLFLLIALGGRWVLYDQGNANSDLLRNELVQKPVRQQNALTSKPNAGHSKIIGPRSGDPSVVLGEVNTQITSEILEEIHDASVTYDPKQLMKIEPYLLHPDSEVRQAAINGMIVLGDASAGALMRAAAAKAPSPQEAVALLEAADYVELPSASEIIRKPKSGGNSRDPSDRSRLKNMRPGEQPGSEK